MLLDEWVNALSDRDESWGPLLFLRPGRHARLSWRRAGWLSILVGTSLGLFGSVVLALIGRVLGREPPPVYLMPLALSAVYFLVWQVMFAPAWNRRAERLSRFR